MNWAKRSQETEIMDNLDLKGEELNRTLKDIDRINSLFGGFKSFFKKIEKIQQKTNGKLVVSDLGCGSGWLLKKLENENWLNVDYVGVDANKNVIDEAKKNYQGSVKFYKYDVFEYIKSLDENNNNLLVSSLFCHHFTLVELKKMLELVQSKKVQFIINDLQRSRVAYYLFKLIGVILGLGKMAKTDGAISIQRGFTKADWYKLLEPFQSEIYSIKWQWAFRYCIEIDFRKLHKKN